MIKCLTICSDPATLNTVSRFIGDIPFLQVVNICSTIEEALLFMEKEYVELILIDENIQPESQEWLKKILLKKQVFLLTVCGNDYGELDIQYYNPKENRYPYQDFNKFLLSISKAYNKLRANENVATAPKFIFVRTNHKLVKINLEDIYFFEGLKDYTKIYITGEKYLLTLRSLKSFEMILPSSSFIRVHRSYIISLDKINEVLRNRILIGKHSIPISHSLKDQFFSLLQVYL